MNKEFNKGLLLAGFGSFWWGFFGVIYFKYIAYIGHIELVVHICLWTAFTLILTTFFFSKWNIFFKIIKKKSNLISKKKEDQPTRIKTCGSTFKNPSNNKKAWELINISGCANLKIGGASISEKHNNFFINNGSARSSDIETLIHKVRETVFKKTGIKLELELKIIGNK